MRIFGDPLARKLGGLGLGIGASVAVPLGACPDALFSDSFESGDTSAWSSVTNPDADLSVTAAAAMAGGSFGLAVLVDDTNPVYVQDNTPANETTYRIRFYLDPNSITMSTGDTFIICRPLTAGVATVYYLSLRKVIAGYQLVIFIRNDDFSNTFYTPDLLDAPNYIEALWIASTAPGANNGIFQVWINGVLTAADRANLDTDTLSVASIRLGAELEIDAGTSGTFYLDAFCSNNTGDEIGP